MGAPRLPLSERFWLMVAKGPPTACWCWTGSRSRAGYGFIRGGGRTLYAHRVSWDLAHGAIPAGIHVLHRCDNPPCVNPTHLFLGTNADNTADKVRKGRCTAPAARINSRVVEQIIAARGTTTQAVIAKRFGVSPATVSMILAGKIWRQPWK